MATNRTRRIAKELQDIQNDTDSQIFCEPANGSDTTKLRASFPGPPDTAYEGGTFIVDITVPMDYPFRPPVMSFSTKLWHPNVSSQTVCLPLFFPPSTKFRSRIHPRPFTPPIRTHQTNQSSSQPQGAICLDTLGSAWSPVLTIKSALISLQSLLSDPEPKDPQDAEVAAMLLNNPEQFQQKAREWSIRFAGAPKVTNWSQNPAAFSKPVAKKNMEGDARYVLSLVLGEVWLYSRPWFVPVG